MAGGGREALWEVDVGPNSLARCRRRAMLTSLPVMAPLAWLAWLAYVAGCLKTLPLGLIAMPKHEPVIACRMATALVRHAQPALFPASRESFMRRPSFGNFRRVLGHLRERCPAAKPVVVRTAWLEEGTAGECVRRPERFVIRLNSYLDEQGAIETVLHEWAHALAWNFCLDRLARTPGTSAVDFEAAAHDEAWGCAYSRVWRTYVTL